MHNGPLRYCLTSLLTASCTASAMLDRSRPWTGSPGARLQVSATRRLVPTTTDRDASPLLAVQVLCSTTNVPTSDSDADDAAASKNALGKRTRRLQHTHTCKGA